MIRETGRRLAAVMFTDIVGYAASSERDEVLTLELLNEHQQILRQIFPNFGGKEIKTTGDGFFCEFSSILDAVHCAIAIQTALFERNLSVDEERKLQIRIGIHLGDVVDFAHDRFGTEVNIAARIEPFAQPGGICVSQQVFDQINGKVDSPIQRLGKLRLKNIKEPLCLYRIALPWEPVKHARILPRGPKTIQGALLGAQVLGVLGILLFVVVKLWDPVALTVDRGPVRSIAETEKPVRQLLLPSHWRYALGKEAESTTSWLPFDVTNTPAYADQFDGDYLLKLEFIGAGGFRHPAMTLGLIPDVHRAYLNGQFIGGSERFSDLAVYSFDPSLIKPGETNTILIKARSRHSFSPGINLLPGLIPKIGEFEDIVRDVIRNQISFQLLRPISLAVSLLLAVASLCYSLFRRGNLKFLYFSCFLFLGTLCLAYYNTFVVASVTYPFYRFMKLLSLSLSSFVLFSLYLNLRGLKRLEAINSILALALALGSAALLLGNTVRPSLYIARYNSILSCVIGYSLCWLGLLGLRAGLKLSRPLELRAVTISRTLEAALIAAFGAVITLLCYSSIFNGEPSGKLKDAALAYPFVFAVLVLAMGIADYTRKSRDVSYKHRKDDFILGIANLAANSADLPATIAAVQSRVAEFLKAARSTIYLLEGDASDRFLKATYIHGPLGIQERIQKVMEPRSGIIGYCLENRSAVFVENITKDPRFRSMTNPENEATRYQTGSCMLFPLLVGSQLLGVITIADRRDGQPFTREDFCLMHLITKDLAFLISHTRLLDSSHRHAA